MWKRPEEETADVDNDESTVKVENGKYRKTGMAWFRYPDGIIPGDHPRHVKGRRRRHNPTYITETFLTSPAFSILVTTMLPIVNLTGAYLAQYLYQNAKTRNSKAVSARSAGSDGHLDRKDTSMILTIVLFCDDNGIYDGC